VSGVVVVSPHFRHHKGNRFNFKEEIRVRSGMAALFGVLRRRGWVGMLRSQQTLSKTANERRKRRHRCFYARAMQRDGIRNNSWAFCDVSIVGHHTAI
jgi:hypothetical protein